ncbi:MAG: DUF2868 domain-containing protein [Burkholderiaceae bacterium]
MTESEALDVTAVRVIETADQDRSVWTDADRAWASHAAAAEVGESAPAEQFIAARARFALGRLEDRLAPLSKVVQALAWRPWVGIAIVLVAALLGLLVDRIGDAQRINVMAPPVLLLMVWNLLVYLVLLTSPLWRALAPRVTEPLRAGLAYLGHGLQLGRKKRLAAPWGRWLGTLAGEWAQQSAPLYLVRAERILHLAAAMLAAGVIAGMYLRGLAFEYRATWESTFLEPSAVRAILSVMLAPGIWMGGHPLADLDRIAAMRAPGSENAAAWLHLIALTLLAVVVLPRLLLAAWAYWHERRLVRTLVLHLERPYFQRLLRGFQVAPNRVQVLPYGFTLSPPAVAGLEILVGRLVGGTASVHLAASAAYGDDEGRSLAQLSPEPGPLVVVFNMAATPERETHAAFAIAAAALASLARPLLVVVDETSFRARAGADPERLAQRRTAWQDVLRPIRIEPAFVELANPDLAQADTAMDAALFVPRP